MVYCEGPQIPEIARQLSPQPLQLFQAQLVGEEPGFAYSPDQLAPTSLVPHLLSWCRQSIRFLSASAQAACLAAPQGSSAGASLAAQALPRLPTAVQCTVASLTRQGYAPGYKNHNQDACVTLQPFMQEGGALFGVLDGHGAEGHRVSEFIKHKLPAILLGELSQGRSASAALHTAFKQADDSMGTTDIDTLNSGSTAVVTLMEGHRLTTAWVGDSRAVLGTRSQPGAVWTASALSQDHKPEQEAERSRIIRAGGRVEQARGRFGQGIGPFRVWLPHLEYPGLAMSRALGDMVVRHVGVTCTPDVAVHQLRPEDQFLVLASDGVFEYLTNEQVVQLVGDTLQGAGVWSELKPPSRATLDRHPGKHSDAAAAGGGGGGGGAALLKQALLRDDVLQGPGRIDQGYGEGSEEDVGEGHVMGHGDARVRAGVRRACAKLVTAARDSWVAQHRGSYIDDISAVVVAFEHT